jgi:hypothetical protein
MPLYNNLKKALAEGQESRERMLASAHQSAARLVFLGTFPLESCFLFGAHATSGFFAECLLFAYHLWNRPFEGHET